MQKMYNMEDFEFARDQMFLVDFYLEDKLLSSSALQGFYEINNSYGISYEKLFKIFIDNQASKHVIMDLYNNGDIKYMLKITKVGNYV